MTVAQVAPFAGEAELKAVLAGLNQAANRIFPPFSDEMVGFCAEFSEALFKDPPAQQFPEVQALAFWMRKTELTRMREEFAALARQDTVLAPRGLVFHIPPANVDTIFVYSWLVAALTGNRNIIRLPLQVSQPVAVICRIFNDLVKTGGPALRENTVMIRYGHEQEITAQISAVADVRILWGGDETIRAIRAVPLPPHATELTFADRYSFAVIHAGRFLAADRAQREKFVGAFFSDVFWFDQMACSSPRLIVWQGEPRETAAASRDFLALLKAHAESKSYQVQPATRLSRFVYACGAIIDQAACTYQDLDAFTVLDVGRLQRLSRNHCGGGLLFQHRISALDELIPFVDRRDQTMTYFGFEPGELRRFACQLNGRGVDRIVPAGRALQFNRFWDGYDLFRELTRHVYLDI